MGLLDSNPILRVKKLREPEGRGRYLGPEEIDRLLTACPPHLRSIVVCAVHTGVRRGEILGLTWDCVDLKNRMIRVTGTKSGRSRAIPLNDPFLDELRRLPRHLKTDYVFWNHETETRFVSIKKAWATALREAKIGDEVLQHVSSLPGPLAGREKTAGLCRLAKLTEEFRTGLGQKDRVGRHKTGVGMMSVMPGSA